MSIKIDMLRTFITVVDCGSLDAAAQELNRTPSAISMTLKQLEQHLGVMLFSTSRKNALTSVGQTVYNIALREIRHFNQTVQELNNITNAVTGLIKIAATPSVATALLPEIIRDYLSARPQTQIEVRDMTSREVVEAIRQQHADIGMGCYDEADEHFYTKHLFSDRFGVICRKDHPRIAHWSSMTWADMQNESFIVNDLCKFIHDPDFVKIRMKSNLCAPNSFSLLAMIRAGLGISILPALAANMLEPDLCFLPLTSLDKPREIYLITQPLPLLTPVAKAFVDNVEQFDYQRFLT